MSEAELRIDAYLDALARELRLDPAHTRRVLIEVEDHLREALHSNVARGLDEVEATEQALTSFGSPRVVARRFHIESGQRFTRALFLQIVLTLGLLGGVGLAAIGASGALAAAMGGVFGKSFVAGDGYGVTYTPPRCAQYLRLDPGAANCTQAALDDHFDEIVFYRLAVGVLGLATLAGCWVVRRRFRALLRTASLPALFGDTAGAAVFGVAACLLLLDGVAGATGSQGGQLSGGIVASLVALWYCRGLLHSLLQTRTA
jgi:hypothetical protein